MTLVSTKKRTNKKHEELWSKIRNLIRSINKSADDYDKKYMKIKFDLDDDLPLSKVIEIHNVILNVRAVFHENKCYLQIFLDECLYKLCII